MEDGDVVVPVLETHGEETVNERINNLFKTPIGLMNTLTATQGWIQDRIYVGTTLDEIKTKKRDYDECWKEFVNVHEQYIRLIVHEEEMESARCSYKEQMMRKMHLDELMASWQRRLKLKARERGEVSSSSGKTSRSSVSKSMSRSLKLSTVSRKREKLALAQLKRTQLFKQHGLERKMEEFNYQEAMEAQMEEEQSLVSLNVYDKEVDVASKDEDTNKYTATIVLQQPQTLSPFVQPYVTQVPPEQPSSIPLQTVHTASLPKRQVGQFEVQLLSTQPYVTEVPPERQQNMLSQPVPITHLAREGVEQPHPNDIDRGEEMVRALRQVVSLPKIKYTDFNGDAINYASFMHNFETCLEKDNSGNCTRLQLLIQHCNGKAREAIESCVNLPAEEGYNTAKNTLYENFGKPHIIAKAYRVIPCQIIRFFGKM